MPDLLHNKKSGKINHQFRSFAHTVQNTVLKLPYSYEKPTPQGIQDKHCKTLFYCMTLEEVGGPVLTHPAVLSPKVTFLRWHANCKLAELHQNRAFIMVRGQKETTLPKTWDSYFCSAGNSKYRQSSSTKHRTLTSSTGRKKGKSKGKC